MNGSGGVPAVSPTVYTCTTFGCEIAAAARPSTLEPLPKELVTRKRGRQDFHGDVPFEREFPREEDGPHAALTQGPQKLVLRTQRGGELRPDPLIALLGETGEDGHGSVAGKDVIGVGSQVPDAKGHPALRCLLPLEDARSRRGSGPEPPGVRCSLGR